MARFPFSAIVGQDEMKLALLIAAVDPSILHSARPLTASSRITVADKLP